MSEVKRVDPGRDLNTSVKEAVADALVNLTYAHVSGAGSVGKHIFGARPRTVLNSGFLLPQKNSSGDDEVTSPIWISSHGIHFQLVSEQPGILTVEPKLTVYVRVLPTEDDYARPDCKVTIKLRSEIQTMLKEDRDARLGVEWEKVKGSYSSRSKHPKWREIKDRVVAEIYAAHGVPTNLSRFESDEPPEDEAADGEGQEGVTVGAETTLRLDDGHFEPISVPHKWLRLDVSLPPLLLDMTQPLYALRTQAGTHGDAMTAALRAVLEQWRDSDDPNSGGRAWGYRHQCEIPASQYHRWSEFLASVRQSKLPVVIPDIALAWNIEASPDWSDVGKTSMLLALENRSIAPRVHVDETDEAVFQVSLVATVPAALHSPLRLERVNPSYRYNKYLNYAAMGHNCGVMSSSADEGLVQLETTWAPRYVQPRIVPTEVEGVNRSVRALSRPEGLAGLQPILPAYDGWLAEIQKSVDPFEGLLPTDTDGREREAKGFSDDVASWKRERDAIAAGIAILIESKAAWNARGAQADPKAAVFEAWLAMNEAMADFMLDKFKTDAGQWRLFQLAFIVANVPAMASRIDAFKSHYHEERDDTATLLYSQPVAASPRRSSGCCCLRCCSTVSAKSSLA